jgi:hypothetical protein
MQRNKPNSEGGVTELVRSLPPTVRQKMDMFGGTTVLDDPILDHHYSNIKEGKTRKNKDGYLNTVVTIQVEDKNLNDGKPTLIPTVYDGKIVSEKEAVKRAIDSGKKWTSADTHAELREYDIMLHKRMSGDLAFDKGGALSSKPKLSGDLSIEGGVSPRKIVTLNDEGNLVEEEVNIGTASALFNANLLVPFGNGFYMRPEVAASVFGVKVKDFEEVQGGLSKYGLTLGKEFSSGNLEASLEQRPGMGGADDETIGMLQGKFRFNEGGTVPMQQQMEMFDLGGLKDEGGTKDPVSGNDVPTGSLKEEVRDDIDAKLSPGEFVFPADVTRFLGLRFLMKLRDEAKAGLQRMEDMGQMGNSDEAVLDEDVPFEPSDLIIVGGTMTDEKDNDKKMNVGGVVESTNEALFQKRYFDPDNPSDTRLIAVFNDVPVTPIPQGFIEDTPENRQNAEQRKTEESTSAMLQKMAKGGMPVKLQTGGDLTDFANVPASGRFEQLVGQPQFGYEVKEFRNAQGNQLFIPFFRGVPSYQPPPGYTEVTPEQQQEAGAQPEKPEETSTLKQDRSSMDPDIESTGGYPSGNVAQQGTIAGAVANPDAFSMTIGQMADYGKAISGQKTGIESVLGPMMGQLELGKAAVIDNMLSNPTPSFAAGVIGKLGKTALGVKGFKGTRDYAKFGQQLAKSLAELSPSELSAVARDYDLALAPQVQQARTALAQTYNDVVARAATAPVYGVTNAQTLQHVDAIGRGNAPPGSSPNAVGGYSTPDFSVNEDGDVMSAEATQTMNDVQTFGISMTEDQRQNLGYGTVDPDLAADIEEAKSFASDVETITGVDDETAPTGTTGVGGTIGDPSKGDDTGAGPVGGSTGPDDETAAAEEGEFGGVEGNVGGFIPKKKKQKKKRSSLALG